jgi:hypothetical protein
LGLGVELTTPHLKKYACYERSQVLSSMITNCVLKFYIVFAPTLLKLAVVGNAFW